MSTESEGEYQFATVPLPVPRKLKNPSFQLGQPVGAPQVLILLNSEFNKMFCPCKNKEQNIKYGKILYVLKANKTCYVNLCTTYCFKNIYATR